MRKFNVLEELGFEQFKRVLYVFSLIINECVSIMVVVQVDDAFTV